ncbi:MAG TPA: toll/interleukin-1 receptor domain-containing protein [Allosphingosinicella sp.]|jgi:hypothetical protein
MAEAEPGAAGGYVAFISYSHKDAAIGRWLHRKLEDYRLPKRLAGTRGEDGQVPARLTPIFRDRDELPAAGDLSERVRAALAVSRNLIVLCSPHSAASPWVAKEIATFRELHPGRSVFTAIVDGEPGQCFSPALLEGGAEPLAADLRKQGDGRRLGLLKLVAGLAGVGLDALVQRDASRRVRRVTYVTAAAVAAMLIMALMTAFALNARSEAERQRHEAEGLVEFMHTDLREGLRGVGRLDIMRPVNERALAFYDRQLQTEKRPADRLMRARILQAIGEDELSRGNEAAAKTLFEETHGTTGALLSSAPNDPDRIFAHAQSEFWLGYMAFGSKDWPTAGNHWRSYKSLADRLVAADAAKPIWLREAGYAEGNLCTLGLVRKSSPSETLRTCRAAVSRMEQVRALAPGDAKSISDLANRYGWLSEALSRNHDKRRALAALQAQQRLLEPLVRRRPDDAKLQDQWMRTLVGLAEFSGKNGQPRQAQTYFREAQAVAEKLIASDPSNAKWAKWLQRIKTQTPSS